MEPGTIVAWVQVGDDDEPPNKWVICDGRKIDQGPWEGKMTPNLTGAFLIGGKQQLVIDKDDAKPMADVNEKGFCIRNDDNNCGVNKDYSETIKNSFNVYYIMKIKANGPW